MTIYSHRVNGVNGGSQRMQSKITDPTPRYAPPLPYDGRGVPCGKEAHPCPPKGRECHADSSHMTLKHVYSAQQLPSFWEGLGVGSHSAAAPLPSKGRGERSEGWGEQADVTDTSFQKTKPHHISPGRLSAIFLHIPTISPTTASMFAHTCSFVKRITWIFCS